MRFTIFVFLALFGLGLSACKPTSTQDKIFNAQSFRLKNGLEVVIVPNHRVPVVTAMIWYKVGAADEPVGFSGMAHYFEHLMFKGTNTMAPGEFSKTVKMLGGNDNAFTGADYTAYFSSLSKDNLDQILTMEADRMVNLNVPQDHFLSEKSVVLEERRQRTDNDPKALFSEELQAALFSGHPYAIPIIGWMKEIETYQWDDVKKFYDQWYAPNNAILIISGDITTKDAKPLIERHFGSLPSKPLPERKRSEISTKSDKTEFTLRHPYIHQPSVEKTFLAPAFQHNKQDSLALQILEQVLDSGSTSRLYKKLVVENKEAVSIGFSYNGTALDYGTISYYGVPQEGKNLTDLVTAIEKQIKDIQTTGITSEELENAKKQLIDSAVFARDSISGPAMIIGYSLATGATLDDIENWPQDIQSITAKQVQDVAKKYLDVTKPWLKQPITGYLYPQEEATERTETQNKEIQP